ncbi:MAG: PD40 domain-containing protein [Kastovskya adunca ATA6-11-RM4]|jgi:WD40 repeat protein|nr:PD40 domain-containing protein [Kastovskya adunca ATA6-11-RM4]
MNNNFFYKIGGSLTENTPSYVVRQADFDLYNQLKAGNFCYIFNSRQMGKTSLQVRTIKRLQAEGIACTTIDISGRGSKDINPEQWYAGIVYTLVANFEIANPSEFIRTWWKENCELPPIQRLDIFVEKFLLENVPSKIVIFIDEIDSILSLKFKADDFFAWIRSCYEKRNFNSEFNRINFVLLGVTTPSDLIADKVRTPFNIGRAIQINGFQIHEISPLASGLKGFGNPQAILQEVLAWTGGQPLLTQKLCDLLVTSPNFIHYESLKAKGEITEVEWVKNIVRQQIIENWDSLDEPPHLKTIKDRILMSKHNTGALLGLYQKILQLGQIPASDSAEQIELRLSGLVVEQQGYLRVYNRIYATVFDLNWIEKALADLRPYSEALSAWFASACQDNSRLLRGKALEDAKNWVFNKNLSQQDYQFLTASQEFEKQEIATALTFQEEESRILAQANETLTTAQHQAKRQIRIGGGVLVCSLIGAAIAFVGATISTNQLRETQLGIRLEQAGVAALKQFETKQIESLVTAVDAGQKLKEIVKNGRSLEKYPASSPIFALQSILDNIREIKQFVAHKDNITTVNWSHDGKYIVTASNDKTARIWNLSGKLIAELKGHQDGVFIANFSPDGKHILTASNDKTVRIWNFSGKQLAILQHQEDVTSASFSPDGKRVITTSGNSFVIETGLDGKSIANIPNDKTARIWDLSGNLLLQLQHQGKVNSANFSPDGKYILTASDDKTARIWDTSGKLLRTFTGHSMAVNSAYWSPNGKYILTNSNDSYIWDVSGKQIAQFKADDQWVTMHAVFSPDSQRILVSTPYRTYVRNLSGRLIREIKNEKVLNGDAGFSPDGKQFFTTDDTIKVWDIRDEAVKVWDLSADLLTELTGNQRSPRWSPDGKYIVTYGQDNIVRIWDLSDRIPVTIKSKDAMTGASWSPDGKYIVTPTWKSILIWDNFGKQLARFQGHSDIVNSANFSPDGKLIVTASNDKTARVWNTSGKQLLSLTGHEDRLEYAAFSPDGKHILTTTYDKKTRIWSDSGKLITTFKARGIIWSPNSNYIMAMFDYDGNNYSSLWNILGEKIVEFQASENSYLGASFSQDGERIVTTHGNIASIWNTSGQKLSEFKANQDIYSPSFSPDGTLVLATSPDNKAIIWDTSDKQLLEIPHQSRVGFAVFSPDGQRIVTASDDGIYRVWDISGKQLAQYKYSSTFISPIHFSPDGNYILAHVQGNSPEQNKVLIWRIDELDGLLGRGCDWLKDYLNTQPQVRERLKVCWSK